MKHQTWYSMLALVGGGLLSLMIYLNSQLASHTSALNSSWIAHGVGAVTAWCLLSVIGRTNKQAEDKTEKVPKLFYLGGLPGAFTVILASTTVNSSIGLSGTLALAIVGQIMCSMLCEYFGLFRLKQRAFSLSDFMPVVLVAAGATLIIFSRS
ncbi:DMT family transporter [Vibrio sp. HN007]|uniref:DMT family transporter n=1 Tax=Vibrio iocasae TaxID=3098914 RepID=UPI0035D3F259